MAHAGNTNCPDSRARCNALVGMTEKGSPIPVTPKAQLCNKILDCVHTTHCAKEFNVVDCLCGKGVTADACFAGTFDDTKGACKDIMAAGGESTSMTIGVEREGLAQGQLGIADLPLGALTRGE